MFYWTAAAQGLKKHNSELISVVSDTHTQITGERNKKRRTDGEVDVFSAMDVTVYPPPPQPLSASDHTRLGQLSYPDPAFGTNKVSEESTEAASVSHCLEMKASFVAS